MSPKDRTDETLYCERCGISFLWSREEQERALSGGKLSGDKAPGKGKSIKPTLCPGCRQLLPAADRERGIVKWFNHRKRYGFIVRANAPDLFMHRSALRERARLRPGDLLEFEIVEGERGPMAANAVLLHRHTDSSNGAP